MISKLIDFFLMKDSPFYKTGDSRYEMGNRIVNPKFASLISTISTLIRHSYTETWKKEDLDKDVKPHTLLEGKVFTLSEKDKIAIDCKKFFIKAIKDGYDNSSMSQIISHLIFNNLDLTKKKIFQLMEIVNEALMSQDFKQAMDLLYHVLIIDDNYTTLRMEWIYGIPQLNSKFADGNIMTTFTFSKYGEKMYKYVSPLLSGTNHDSLIDKILRLQSHSEFVHMLNYFFALVFKRHFTFNYFDALPSPKEMNQPLKDYIFELIKEELSRPYFVTNKQNEKPISLITKIIDKYEIYKSDFALKSSGPRFRPTYKLGATLKEFMDMIIDENINLKNVYLISLDYESEVLTGNEVEKKKEIKEKQGDGVKLIESVNSEEKKQDNDFQLIKIDETNTNNTSDSKDISSSFTSKLIDPSNWKQSEAQYNNQVYINGNHFNSGKNEEEFYKKVIVSLMDHLHIFRTFVNIDPSTKVLANCMKKYILFNSKHKY